MQNIVINVCKKFHGDRSKNDRALGDLNYNNNNHSSKHKNNNNNNAISAWRPVSGSIIN